MTHNIFLFFEKARVHSSREGGRGGDGASYIFLFFEKARVHSSRGGRTRDALPHAQIERERERELGDINDKKLVYSYSYEELGGLLQ